MCLKKEAGLRFLSVILLPVISTELYADPILYTVYGDGGDDFLGFSVSGAGDVNGDGYVDFIAGAEGDDNNGNRSGSARVYSGIDGSILYTVFGDDESDQFGWSVSGAGDVNSDGYSDFIIGALYDDDNEPDSGSARVYSGLDGGILYTVYGDFAGDNLGVSVSGAGDVNNDGYADFIAGADRGGSSGFARVFSGINGDILYTVSGGINNDNLGASVSGAGDVNNDGYADFIVGDYRDDNNGSDSGSAIVYSGNDGTVLHTVYGDNAYDNLGVSVSGAGDVNNDGYDDFIAGAHRDDNNGNASGMVRVYSGEDASVLYSISGNADYEFAGRSVGEAGDINKDSYADFLVGASNSVAVYSGIDGSILYMVNGDDASDSLGISVSGTGDINGDGYDDFIAGAHGDDNNGDSSGSARVYSGKALWNDHDIDGQNDLVDIDDDNDGVLDIDDLYPFDNTESVDSDNDGVGDNADLDDDNDGIDDSIDNCQFTPNTDQLETDGDGDGNACDDDDDNDGVLDVNDVHPLDSVRFTADSNIMYTVNGDDAGDNLGFSVSDAGDVNGDGYTDFIAGVPHDDDSVEEVGSSRVYSGLDGSIIYIVFGDDAYDELGTSVSGAGDINSDGYADFVVGATGHDNVNGDQSGLVRVYSGFDGSILYSVYGDNESDGLGGSVSDAGDVNNDGYSDFIAGAAYDDNNGSDSGSARVYSGLDGGVLYTVSGDSFFDYLGRSVSGAGDVNNDGYADFIVGAPDADINGAYSGYVRVYSGIDGTVLYTYYGDNAADRVGSSVSDIGDINKDNYADFIIGASGDDGGGLGSGAARVYSGIDGSILYVIYADIESDNFGISVSGGEDINNDGYEDFVIGDHYNDAVDENSGVVRVYSGLDGSVIYIVNGDGRDDYLGWSVSAMGDLNGDGYADFIAGAYAADNNGDDSGVARVYSGKAIWNDNDTDGQIDAVDNDDDNDGVLDVNDLYPLDPTESVDFDNDGIGDVADLDDDQDGVDDIVDNCLFLANPDQLDTDGDDIGNACDDDDDNDGVLDVSDYYPLNSARALADTNFIYTVRGDSASDELGISVSDAGDVNNDGYADFIAGAYFDDNNGSSSGSARVFSGIDGSILYTVSGDSGSDLLGSAVSGAGDVNGDGYADFIAGAYFDDDNGSNSGSARVYSGVDGSILYTVYGDSLNDNFGISVSSVGDVNNDGYADFIVGAHKDDNNGSSSGSARVFSGIDGSVLYMVNGDNSNDLAGISVSGAGDVNSDGYLDFIVGASGDDNNGVNSGSARVYSGINSSILYTVYGDISSDNLGRSVSGAGDVNNDGYADFIAGAPGNDYGYARVFSGIDGSTLYTLYGKNPLGYFGFSVSDSGDVNNDGFDDFIVGDYSDNNVNGYGSGFAQVYSGMDGSVLYTAIGDGSGDRLGGSVGSAGDINSDGYADYIVGAYWDNNNGISSGSVRVYSGKALWNNNDGDGSIDTIDGDDDNDGILDIDDLYPLNAFEYADSDNDGKGDNLDVFPSDPYEWLDSDSDGVGNNTDWDDDDDGVPDIVDAESLNSANSSEINLPLDSGYKGVVVGGAHQ